MALSDNEIIKALPKILYGGHGCTNCRYGVTKGDERCGLKGCIIARNALDLINRQKAEIEFLKQDALTPVVTKIGDEIARRQKIKAEAIKEFAERLKKAGFNGMDVVIPEEVVFIDDIDNLVKEMVGDNDA